MQIKHLYVNGDSFAFGQELGGPTTPTTFYDFTDYHREHSYGNVLAQHFGITGYINKAIPGSSNASSVRRTIEDLTILMASCHPSEIFVNVSITHAARKEFYNSKSGKYYDYINNWRPDSKQSDKHIVTLWETITAYFDDPRESVNSYITEVLSLRGFLTANKIPFLLTNSMQECPEIIKELANKPIQIRNALVSDRHLATSFHEFVNGIKAPCGPEFHPLELGHAEWGKHLIKHIERNNLLILS